MQQAIILGTETTSTFFTELALAALYLLKKNSFNTTILRGLKVRNLHSRNRTHSHQAYALLLCYNHCHKMTILNVRALHQGLQSKIPNVLTSL